MNNSIMMNNYIIIVLYKYNEMNNSIHDSILNDHQGECSSQKALKLHCVVSQLP